MMQIGAFNQGITGPLSDSLLPGIAQKTAMLGGMGLLAGGGYIATLSADGEEGNRSFASSSTGELDLMAKFDGLDLVEIPLSSQTLPLGTLQPNERLLIGYLVTITVISNDGKGGFRGSSPHDFGLSGEPNPIFALGGVTLTPIPEPQVTAMLIAGLLVVSGAGYRRTRLPSTRRPTP
jgi:hypothetical protein